MLPQIWTQTVSLAHSIWKWCPISFGIPWYWLQETCGYQNLQVLKPHIKLYSPVGSWCPQFHIRGFHLESFPDYWLFSIMKTIQLPFFVGMFGEISDCPSDPGWWGGGSALVISWPGARDAMHPTLCRTVLHKKELSCPCSLNLPWKSFHGICKSNHHALHLKLIQCCMSIKSQ